MIFSRKTPEKFQDAAPSQGQDKVTFMVKRDVKKFLDAGKKFLESGRIEEAIKLYTSAVKADESCALCHFNLGYAYHEKGEREIAKERYQKAVELEPTCSLFIEHLARLNFENLEYQEALKLFQRASLVGPIQPVSLGLWGRALFEQGLFDQSIEAFEKLIEQETQSVILIGAYYWMTMAHLRLGNIAAARKRVHKILSFEEIDQKILFDLGEQFIQNRCLSLARNIFEQIVIQKEESMLARMRLEDIRSLEEKIDAVLPKLYDGDEEKSLHQIHALREFGNDKISKVFSSLTNSDSAPIREAVIKYQTTFGYDVTESVLPLLNDPIHYVRDASFDYLSKLDSSEHTQEFINGLNDELPSVRSKCVKFLSRFGTMEVVPLLEMMVDEPKNDLFKDDLRRAIRSIKKRYQENIDNLYTMDLETTVDSLGHTDWYDWKRWLLITLQIVALGYFVYYLFASNTMTG